MTKVFLLLAKFRYKFGSPQVTSPSRFLKEIDKRLIDKNSSYNDEPVKEKPVIGPDEVKWIALPKKKPAFKTKEFESKKTINGYRIGTRVEHNMFGKGIILESYGLGEDTKIVVDFENGYKKTLMVLYANLTILE
jgi:DNA helicase II / ATP-dependent DNA helicase PcrA